MAGWELLSGPQAADLSLCFHLVEGVRDLCEFSFTRTLISFMRAPLSWHHNLPRLHSLIPTHLRVRIQHMNLEGHKHLDHTTMAAQSGAFRNTLTWGQIPAEKPTGCVTWASYLTLLEVCFLSCNLDHSNSTYFGEWSSESLSTLPW